MSGLWGNFDLNAGNDMNLIHHLNNQGKLSVLGTARSYFTDKTPRKNKLGQFLLATESSSGLDLHVDPGNPVATTSVEIPKDKVELVQKWCGSLRGKPRAGCNFDIANGAKPQDTFENFHMDAVQEDSKALIKDKCSKLVDSVKVTEKELTFGEGASVGTSFAIITWFKFNSPVGPDTKNKYDGEIASRGTVWSLVIQDSRPTFSVGDVTCQANDAIASSSWIHIAGVANVPDKKIYLYVNGEEVCSSALTTVPPPSNDAIILPASKPADGIIGKTYYTPLNVFKKEIKERFADVANTPRSTLPGCA